MLQEAIVLPPWVAFAVGLRPDVWDYVCVIVDELAVEQFSIPKYLEFQEHIVDEGSTLNENDVKVDVVNHILHIS